MNEVAMPTGPTPDYWQFGVRVAGALDVYLADDGRPWQSAGDLVVRIVDIAESMGIKRGYPEVGADA